MTFNWIGSGSDTTVLKGDCGRRFFPIALAAASVAACTSPAIEREYENQADQIVQRARFFQNRETGMCAVIMGDGNITTIAPVVCTPEILTKVYRP